MPSYRTSSRCTGDAERETRQDRHLRGGVAAGDIIARVGLGVADALRLGERLLVARAVRHPGEDEVGRAVDDPVDPLDRRRRERLLEHPHDGHGARDRGLEAQPDVVGARGLEQLLAVLGEELLVGGHDVLSRTHRAQQVFARRFESPDQLDEQIGAGQHLLEPPSAARQYAADDGPAPVEALDLVGALLEQLVERPADGAVAEQPDPSRAQRTSRPSRSSKLSRRTTTRASPSRQKRTGGRGTPL